MFSGIVQGTGELATTTRDGALVHLRVRMGAPYVAGLRLGASVAVDGVCLTVTKIDGDQVSFDVIDETLRRTTLGELQAGDRVNIERSITLHDEIGGHLVSGHVHGVATVADVNDTAGRHIVTFEVSHDAARYIFPKGFIALNGCSLTVVDVDRQAGRFTVSLIPETLRMTTFANKTNGARVNVEIDSQTRITVDTVEAYLKSIRT